MQPDQSWFTLTGNRAVLLKANVVSPSGAAAPEVSAIVASGGETNTFLLKGPAMLPKSLSTEPGTMQHRYEDSFTTIIPARLVRNGLIIEVHADASVVRHKIKVGAPTIVHLKMFDVHYFGRGEGDYPTNLFSELAAKWPVAGLDIERVRGLTFPEMVIPARAGLPAVRITSTDEYKTKTGQKFTASRLPRCSGSTRCPAPAAMRKWRCATSLFLACLRADRRKIATAWAA